MTELYRLTENIFRIRHWAGREPRESLLSRYGILDLSPEGEPELLRRDGDPHADLDGNGRTLWFSLAAGAEGGFGVRLPLDPGERLYGLGDESRDCIEKHGKIAVMKQENVRPYGPMPFLMSSAGWALLVNCTYAHTFDIAASEPDVLRIFGPKGALDLIIFCGTDLHSALFLAGKVITPYPRLPPFPGARIRLYTGYLPHW